MKLIIVAIIFLLIFFWMLTVIPVTEIFDSLRKKQYYKIYSRNTVYEMFAREMSLIYVGIYSKEITCDMYKIYSKQINVDAYDFRLFCIKYKKYKREKIIYLFEKYKECNFELNYVEKMNTKKDYCNIVRNLEMYNELKELHFRNRKNSIKIIDKEGEL